MTVRFLIAVSLLVAGPVVAQSPSEGRWRLSVEGGSLGRDTGDLRLTLSGDSLAGTLLLESSDSAPVSVRGSSRGDSLEFRSGYSSFETFVGVSSGDRIEGQLWSQGRPVGRWSAIRIDSDAEVYIPLPRFTVRQVVGGLDSQVVLPGRWLSAARSAGFTPERLSDSYRHTMVDAALSPLDDSQLPSLALLRAMGLFRRDELRSGAIAALGAIRQQLSSDTSVARFDYLFRAGDDWVVDLHDRALATTRGKFPEVTWDLVAPALRAAGVNRSPVPEGTSDTPLALYQLYVLQQTDSAAYADAAQRILQHQPELFQPVLRLLRSYHEATDWYREAVGFLTVAPWAAGESPARLLQRVATWPDTVAVPTIEIHLFGYPDGSLKVGVTDEVAQQLIVARNHTARRWLERHGSRALLSLLDRVPLENTPTVIEDDQVLEVTGYAERRLRPTGFLEPAGALVLDPSYLPLWAVGTLLHEWVHLWHETARESARLVHSGEILLLSDQPNPFMAEGLAEVMAQAVLLQLAPITGFIAVGEVEKRAALGAANPDDPHAAGADLVAALLEAVPDTAAMVMALTQDMTDLDRFVARPAVSRWLSPHQGHDRTFKGQALGFLVPETTLVIDGMSPVVEGRRIIPLARLAP